MVEEIADLEVGTVYERLNPDSGEPTGDKALCIFEGHGRHGMCVLHTIEEGKLYPMKGCADAKQWRPHTSLTDLIERAQKLEGRVKSLEDTLAKRSTTRKAS